jgi:SAM-dependent methyltransferase
MEYVSCDYCGSAEHAQVVRQTDLLHRTTDEVFSIVRCTTCGLHFLNPRPDREEIGKYYSEKYSFHSDKSLIKNKFISIMTSLANSPFHIVLNFIPPISRMLVPYIQPRIMDPIRKLFRGGNILDIGCGSGVTAHFWGVNGSLQAYSKFADVHGLEVADVARSVFARKGIPSYKYLTNIPADLGFDIIRMNWSLEHVHSPSEYFNFIKDRLQQEGIVILTVPNYGGLLYLLAPDCVEVPVHLFHFKKQDIYNYAAKYKLKVVKFQTFSYPGMYVFSAGISPQMAKAFAFPMGISEANYSQRLLSRLDALEMGNDMLFVLRKNS